jgi:hypothetical protein
VCPKEVIAVQDSRKEERRSHPRVERPIHLRPSSVFGQEYRISNISLGGMRVQSQKSPGRGEILKIKLSFPDGEWTDVNVRVVWIRKRNKDTFPLFDVGCEFVDLPFDTQSELWMLLDRDSKSH